MSTKKNFLHFGVDKKVNPTTSDFELEESDLWNSSEAHFVEHKRSIFGSHTPKKKPAKKNDNVNGHGRAVAASSLPINMPDWSKVLRDEYVNGKLEKEEYDNGDNDISWEDENDRIPPHEYLARTRVASFSVQEGVGRTLKGRDMRRVRNAIWKQTGFED